MVTMVPDQCCEKIDCIYSYMGLNHGTRCGIVYAGAIGRLQRHGLAVGGEEP